MTPLQEKLLDYSHGWFMGIGLLLFLAGFAVDIELVDTSFQYTKQLMVIGALVLGYGTGRCDEKCKS